MNKNKEKYIHFCKNELDLPIFSQPWFLDIVCGDNGWDILLVMKDNKVAASMPVPKQNKVTFQFSRTPVLAKYLGPYFSKKFSSVKQQEKLLKLLINQMPCITFFNQNFNPTLTNWLPFFWENFAATTSYTFVLDLSKNINELYNNIDGNYRNNKIAKAKQSITIRSDLNLLDFYDVQSKTLERQNIEFPFSFDFIKKYDAILKEKNAREIFFAIDKEKNIHSVAYLIWDRKTTYLQMIGDDPTLRKSGAGILLTWHMIKYAKEVLQKERFDFLGSMIEPITNVRESFGATPIPYLRIQKLSPIYLNLIYDLKRLF